MHNHIVYVYKCMCKYVRLGKCTVVPKYAWHANIFGMLIVEYI